MKLPTALQKKLDEIEQDCQNLKKNGDLTDYGQGQLDLITIIKGIVRNEETD